MNPSQAPRLPCRLLRFAVLALLPASAFGQDFTRSVARANETLVTGILPDSLTDLFDPTGAGMKGIFSLGLSTQLNYNSNINLAAFNEEDELSWSITPSIVYSTDPEGGARYVATAYYAPSAQIYIEDSSKNGINHSGGASFKYQAAKTSISAYANYAQSSGSDRFTGTFSETTVLTAGIGIAYQIAPRTSIYGSATVAMSDYDSGTQIGSDIYSYGLGAYWAATERFSFGPALGYDITKSTNSGERRSTTFSIRAKYDATERLDFRGSIGVSSSEDSRLPGSREVGLVCDLYLRYKINELWSYEGSASYATVPSPSTANYIAQDWVITSGLARSLNYGSVSFGIEMGFSNYEVVGPTAVSLGNETIYSLILSYRRPLFNDRVLWENSFRYSRNYGQTDWSQYQFSTGLSASF